MRNCIQEEFLVFGWPWNYGVDDHRIPAHYIIVFFFWRFC